MFQFKYKGKYDCLIPKDVFETYVQDLYNDMKKRFNVTWSPKKFVVTMEMDPKRPRGWGGNTDYDRKTDIIYRLHLQLFGLPKKEQTFDILQMFFGNILRHEMLHFFIPSIKDNSCWSEGVTDFMTYWYTDTISENLSRLQREYKEITDSDYKAHKYGYITGFKKMNSLYTENKSLINDMKRIIKDFNMNSDSKKKEYTSSDIIDYNSKFKTFFIGKCNIHALHEL